MKRTPAPLAIAFALLLVLAACAGPGADAPGSPTTDAAASTTPSPEPAASPEPEPEPTFDAEDRGNVIAAIDSQNYAAIEAHLSNPVNVIQAATECCGPRTPAEAIQALNYLSGAASPWNFTLDPGVVDSYRAGYYGQYIPEGALVGRSADGWVVAFAISGDEITGVFMSVSDELLL